MLHDEGTAAIQERYSRCARARGQTCKKKGERNVCSTAPARESEPAFPRTSSTFRTFCLDMHPVWCQGSSVQLRGYTCGPVGPARNNAAKLGPNALRCSRLLIVHAAGRTLYESFVLSVQYGLLHNCCGDFAWPRNSLRAPVSANESSIARIEHKRSLTGATAYQ